MHLKKNKTCTKCTKITCEIFRGKYPTSDKDNIRHYLGATITADGRSKKEIRRRIGMAKDAFNKMRAIFTNSKLSLNIKLHLIFITFV